MLTTLPKPQLYHADGQVDISDGWATFSGKHYKLADITSVRLTTLRNDRLLLWALAYAAILLLILISTISLISASILSASATQTITDLGFIKHVRALDVPLQLLAVFTAVCLLIAAWRWRTSNPIYLLQLTGDFGRVSAFASTNRDYITTIHKSLLQALTPATS